VKNLCCGCYLPVEVSTTQHHVQREHQRLVMGERPPIQTVVIECERGNLGPEISCTANKLLDVWNRIGQLIKEIDLKFLEDRDGDPGKKRFQVSTGASEPKPAEVWEYDVRQDPGTQ
jgi:hypothetical protein